MAFLQNRREKAMGTTEGFLTARGTMGMWKVAWSFFATAVGAWCITSPASFAVYTGILGLAMYAFSAGFPLFIIALMGNVIQGKFPHVLTFSDFIGYRFGPVFRTFVVCVVLFNMSIALLAEYTTIGSLFEDFVGSLDYPPIIVVGVLTMAYTSYGGLYVSIITDQVWPLADL
jgi:SSS family solute:Na+ symporter